MYPFPNPCTYAYLPGAYGASCAPGSWRCCGDGKGVGYHTNTSNTNDRSLVFARTIAQSEASTTFTQDESMRHTFSFTTFDQAVRNKQRRIKAVRMGLVKFLPVDENFKTYCQKLNDTDEDLKDFKTNSTVNFAHLEGH
ncbi:hypothetical protein E2P81_ATG05964 [Venturia nashicola]|uniref:Uncharacterized protein n=1 Tax=Venturia nashicola TaxID=86259 RepID=A0A4Z1P9R3_9PEZI|nr:hypothetical protein E6O75_ATG06110 [Venturia nashicola]TLD29670.1 hypothetical protein E2P81_ATG05964 [Venturia nashicola]